MDSDSKYFIDTLNEISNQIEQTSKSIIWNEILSLIDLILNVNKENNRIFIYGAGRSGFIGRCFAQRLMHLGIKSCFISDAVTYRYTNNDLLIIISGSGETTSPLAISKKARDIGGKLILLTNNPESSIGKISDLVINVHAKSKDKFKFIKSLAPYTSLFDISVLSILDAIGGILMKKLGITEQDIDKFHASLE